MHPNGALLESFYAAFQQRNHVRMSACYGPAIVFRDPVFTLQGWRVGAMWRMLCERGKDLRLEYRDIQADDSTGSLFWEAWYTFSGTGRAVHNRIQASFGFQDGRIVRHQDQFSLYRWAAQALGPKGLLVGWAPPVQQAIRRNAARTLESYIQKSGMVPPAS